LVPKEELVLYVTTQVPYGQVRDVSNDDTSSSNDEEEDFCEK